MQEKEENLTEDIINLSPGYKPAFKQHFEAGLRWRYDLEPRAITTLPTISRHVRAVLAFEMASLEPRSGVKGHNAAEEERDEHQVGH